MAFVFKSLQLLVTITIVRCINKYCWTNSSCSTGKRHALCEFAPCISTETACNDNNTNKEIVTPNDMYRHNLLEKHNEVRETTVCGEEDYKAEITDMNRLSYDLELEFFALLALNLCDELLKNACFKSLRGYTTVYNKIERVVERSTSTAQYDSTLEKNMLTFTVGQYERSNGSKGCKSGCDSDLKMFVNVVWAKSKFIGCAKKTSIGVAPDLFSGALKNGTVLTIICFFGPHDIPDKDLPAFTLGNGCSQCDNSSKCDESTKWLCETVSDRNTSFEPPYDMPGSMNNEISFIKGNIVDETNLKGSSSMVNEFRLVSIILLLLF